MRYIISEHEHRILLLLPEIDVYGKHRYFGDLSRTSLVLKGLLTVVLQVFSTLTVPGRETRQREHYSPESDLSTDMHYSWHIPALDIY